jgi:fatty acid desaturase
VSVDESASESARLSFSELPEAWTRLSRVRGLADVALVWAGIFAVVAFCGYLESGWIHLVGIVGIGILQNNISSLAHHAIHNNIHPERRLNDGLTRLLLAAPLAQLFSVLRAEHLHHHAHLGATDDAERYYYDLTRHGRREKGHLVRWVGGLFIGWVALGVARRTLTGSREGGEPPATRALSERGKRERILDLLAIPPMQIAVALAMWLVHGQWWAYLALWAIPAVTVGGGLTALRATLDHADAGQPPDLDLSYVSNPLERFVVAPFNFNYHFEHHRFMTVPYYHVAKLRPLLQARGEFEGVQLLPGYVSRIRQLARELKASPNNQAR